MWGPRTAGRCRSPSLASRPPTHDPSVWAPRAPHPLPFLPHHTSVQLSSPPSPPSLQGGLPGSPLIPGTQWALCHGARSRERLGGSVKVTGRGRGAGPGLESHLLAPRPRLHAPPGDKHVRRPSGETGLLTVKTGNPPGLPGCAGRSTGREGPAYCRPAWSLSPPWQRHLWGRDWAQGLILLKEAGTGFTGPPHPPSPSAFLPLFVVEGPLYTLKI